METESSTGLSDTRQRGTRNRKVADISTQGEDDYMRISQAVFALIAAVSIIGCGDDDPVSSRTVTLTIENRIADSDGDTYDIFTVRISPAGSDSWGDDRLGSTETLAFGASKAFDLISGKYDLRVQDEDGGCYYDVGRSLSKDFTWRVTGAAFDAECTKGKPVALRQKGGRKP
jgi:hypothetical protein